MELKISTQMQPPAATPTIQGCKTVLLTYAKETPNTVMYSEDPESIPLIRNTYLMKYQASALASENPTAEKQPGTKYPRTISLSIMAV